MRTTRSVRFTEEVDKGVEALARRTGRDRSAVVNEILDEGLRMRRFPGIAFADSASGRVARLAGTGIKVWLLVRDYRDMDSDWDRLREAYHWLTEQQLRTALAYAEAYPDEIDRRIDLDESWTPERVYAEYPFMRPRS